MDGGTSFGQWLKQQRKALDLTQEALGQQVGIVKLLVEAGVTGVGERPKGRSKEPPTAMSSSYAAICRLVTSFQVWNRRARSRRYSAALSRCRRGLKCSRIGPKAARNRWA